jgi:hypothetical protein
VTVDAAPSESPALESQYRDARAAGRLPEALDALQRMLQGARERGDRVREGQLLDELGSALRAAGDSKRAGLIAHYRAVGFRRPLGYD